MRQFRIVHLRSLSMADDYAEARPRPALTIFVRLLLRLLDPVHGPVQKCKHASLRGLARVAVPPAGNDEVLLCSSTKLQSCSIGQCDAARLQE